MKLISQIHRNRETQALAREGLRVVAKHPEAASILIGVLRSAQVIEVASSFEIVPFYSEFVPK